MKEGPTVLFGTNKTAAFGVFKKFVQPDLTGVRVPLSDSARKIPTIDPSHFVAPKGMTAVDGMDTASKLNNVATNAAMAPSTTNMLGRLLGADKVNYTPTKAPYKGVVPPPSVLPFTFSTTMNKEAMSVWRMAEHLPSVLSRIKNVPTGFLDSNFSRATRQILDKSPVSGPFTAETKKLLSSVFQTSADKGLSGLEASRSWILNADKHYQANRSNSIGRFFDRIENTGSLPDKWQNSSITRGIKIPNRSGLENPQDSLFFGVGHSSSPYQHGTMPLEDSGIGHGMYSRPQAVSEYGEGGTPVWQKDISLNAAYERHPGQLAVPDFRLEGLASSPNGVKQKLEWADKNKIFEPYETAIIQGYNAPKGIIASSGSQQKVISPDDTKGIRKLIHYNSEINSRMGESPRITSVPPASQSERDQVAERVFLSPSETQQASPLSTMKFHTNNEVNTYIDMMRRQGAT